MKKLLAVLFVCLAMPSLFAQHISPEEALKSLKDGNNRFISETNISPGRDLNFVKELAHGQHPYAIVVCCSDSRTPPELLFDEGFGKLFVIRVAGNIVGQYELGSIEYAAKKLGVQLVLVLGHSECGAVHATVEAHDYGANINSIVSAIMPSVEKAKTKQGDVMENAVEENVLAVQKNIEGDTELKGLYSESKLKVVPAVYHLETGKVTFLEY
jgi:carbonic anhydrase